METTTKEKAEFRNYEQGDITAAVKEHYRKMRSRQTYEYVLRMKKKWCYFAKIFSELIRQMMMKS
jgi:inositol oxygenase